MSKPLSVAQVQSIGSAASGIGQLVGGIVGMANQEELEERASANLDTALQELADLRASQPSLSTPSAYYEGVKGAYDQRLLQMRMDDINRSLATTAQAATQFGARGLGALAGATAQAQRSQREEALTQQRLQSEALMQLGAAEERSTQLQEARSARNIEFGYDAKALAEAQVAQADQQRIQNFANIAGGIAGLAGGITGAAIGTGKKGMKVGYRMGGKTKEAPFVTEGEFDHDTNKKAVVDEESGVKEAELTGGEYVFNPEQSETLFKLAKEGDTPLHKYLLKLLLRFERDV
tara:strand:+ start:3650 stop:4525 length:876 start_codon:yes stop_codon:yes gene_type:complete